MNIYILLAVMMSISMVTCQDNSTIAAQYNSFCYACVHNGFYYCGGTGICHDTTGNCSSGIEYNTTVPCPTTSYCSNIGIYGVVFVGDSTDQTQNSGIDVTRSGSMPITVNNSASCYLTFFNYKNKHTQWAIYGSANADLTYLSYPNNF